MMNMMMVVKTVGIPDFLWCTSTQCDRIFERQFPSLFLPNSLTLPLEWKHLNLSSKYGQLDMFSNKWQFAKKCPEGQFAKKDNWNESRKICKEMIHNDNLQNMLSRRTIWKTDNWDENFKFCKKESIATNYKHFVWKNNLPIKFSRMTIWKNDPLRQIANIFWPQQPFVQNNSL